RLGEILVEAGSTSADDITIAAHQQELGDDRRLGEILVDDGRAAKEAVEAAAEQQATASGSSVADTSIRVDVGLLDDLMNLVGELVLTRNQLVQLVDGDTEDDLTDASKRLNLVTTELQEGVMKTRMQPIGNVWNKLPRVVRDLSVSCGKQVRLAMEGQNTELDKTIIEAIKDPLTHLVRNAVDHGIEAPQDRAAAGKPEEGELLLRAFHEGGQVNIEIIDDGGGIRADAVRDKAVQAGVVSAEQAERMSDREAVNLIFAAGFSTASQVTSVSGRGVGMDVVRTNIERIGGTVDVQTEPGAGSSFKVKIPLTLAIVPGLMVASGDDRFVIPQLSLIELVRLEADEADHAIEMVHGAPVYRLRGRLLPIVDLSAELGHRCDRSGQAVNIVVLHADGQRFGLVVDAIHDTEEIVVKPLGSHLKEATLFSGATIMGDGRVALILDVLGIAQRARVMSEAAERSVQTEGEPAADDGGERRTLLLVDVGERRRAAIALSEVERLEELPSDSIELAGGREVVQYRGDILPLRRLADLIGAPGPLDPPAQLPVIVHRIEGHTVGLVVERFVDIIEQEVVLDEATRGFGVLGSAVFHDRITDVLDIHALLSGDLVTSDLVGV
ncbi:MAG: chemotaxis protein CheA, partial [Nitriliruptoraceae bacterium]